MNFAHFKRLSVIVVCFAGIRSACAAENLDLASMIRPAPESAKFSDPDWYIWCGSMAEGNDGKYHLFYSRWPRKLGHNAWVTHSEVARAVADSPLGPYKHVDVTLPERGPEFWDGHCTHNPTVIRARDGKFYLYYMGNRGDRQDTRPKLNFSHRNNQRIGVAVADTPAGPWKRFDKPVMDVTPGAMDSLMTSNPTVCQSPDGKFVMIYKGVGDKKPLPFGGPVLLLVATSDSPTGPFKKHDKPVFVKEGVNFAAEDPFIFYWGGKYRAVVKDNAGHFTPAGKSLILFESENGLDWELAKSPLISKIEVMWAGGRVQKLNSLERPQIWLDGKGRPAVLFCAVDEDSRREFSYNVHIPLSAKQQK